MDNGSANLQWASHLVAGFAAAGVRHAVISPGSRSTPLTLALLRHPDITSHLVLDERSAAFFALGLAKAEGCPALVVATSGSAPGNWLPAVIEANHGLVPLLLLSADRPPELQDWGANQTIRQINLFADQVRSARDLGLPPEEPEAAYLHRVAARAVEESRWPLAGPVHLNLPFREPLLPAELLDAPAAASPAPPAVPSTTQAAARAKSKAKVTSPSAARETVLRLNAPAPARPSAAIVAELAAAIAGQPGLIVCGQGADAGRTEFPAAITELAAALACPILAEPLSNLRFGAHSRRHVLARHDAWLRAPGAAGNARWILRFGAFPVGRTLQGLVNRPGLRQVLVEPTARWIDPGHTVTDLIRADPTAFCQALLAQLVPTSAAAPAPWMEELRRLEEVAGDAPQLPVEARLIRQLITHAPAACPIFVGNSMVIRDVDSFTGCGAKPLDFQGNRGASGIDGNLATALGIAATRGRVIALVGDLTAQHDLGSLAAARGLNALIVVFNNGGGGIFEYLPQAALPEFSAGWLTPQAVDFASAARTFGLAYRSCATAEDFATHLAQALAAGGPYLIEVTVDRAASVAAHRAYWDHCRTHGQGVAAAGG